MTRFLRRTATALATAALAVPLLAPSVFAQPARPDVGARITEMTSGLALTPDQQARLAEVSARYRGQTDPAALWAAAADVQRVLTAEQTAGLAERRAAVRAARREQGRALSEAFRPRTQALVAGLRAGQISDADFERQARALRDEARAQREANLTPEQRQRAAEARTRREAARTARERALGLTDAQREAARALAIERIRTAPERPARGTARPDAAERRQRVEAGRASREALQARAAQILTPEQKAVQTVHRALAGAGRDGVQRGEGRRGRRSPAGRPLAPRE